MNRYQYQNECYDHRYAEHPSNSGLVGESYYGQESTYFDRPRTHRPGRNPRPFEYTDDSFLENYTEVIKEPVKTIIMESISKPPSFYRDRDPNFVDHNNRQIPATTTTTTTVVDDSWTCKYPELKSKLLFAKFYC